MSADFLARMAAVEPRARRAGAQRVLRAALQRAARVPHRAAAARSSRTLGFDLIAEVKLRSPASRRAASAGARISRRARAGLRRRRCGGDLGADRAQPVRWRARRTWSRRGAGARRAASGDAQGLPGRSLPGVRGARGRRRRRAGDSAHARARCSSWRCSRPAQELGLFVLLEAFDEARPRAARPSWSSRIARDLHAAGRGQLPRSRRRSGRARAARGARTRACRAGVPRVAESGVESGADAARLVRAGYDVALVGSALMRSRDPARSRARCSRLARRGAALAQRAPDASPHLVLMWIKICGMTESPMPSPRRWRRGSMPSASCSRLRCGALQPREAARAGGAGARPLRAGRGDAASRRSRWSMRSCAYFRPDVLQTDLRGLRAAAPAARRWRACRCCASRRRRCGACRAGCCSRARAAAAAARPTGSRRARLARATRTDPRRRPRRAQCGGGDQRRAAVRRRCLQRRRIGARAQEPGDDRASSSAAARTRTEKLQHERRSTHHG